MLAKPLLGQILDNEALTRGLEEPESRILVEWLVDQAERLAERSATPAEVEALVGRLCRRARALSRFVRLWCHEGSRRAACQLAAVERFAWPLPTRPQDPYELMDQILRWEGAELAREEYRPPTAP